MSRTDCYGRDVHDVQAPFRLLNAKPRTPDEGGTLDRGIVATLEDGRQVVIGELWAAGPTIDGARVSLDAEKIGRTITELLNRELAGAGAPTPSGEEVVGSVQ